MTTKKGTSENGLQASNNSVSAVENAAFISAIKEAKNVETKDLNELTGAQFVDFDKLREKQKVNEFHFAFVGMTKHQDKTSGEERDVVKLVDEAGNDVLCGDAVMISTMKKWQAKNPDATSVIIRVTYNGEMKQTADGKGKYRNLQIHSF